MNIMHTRYVLDSFGTYIHKTVASFHFVTCIDVLALKKFMHISERIENKQKILYEYNANAANDRGEYKVRVVSSCHKF